MMGERGWPVSESGVDVLPGGKAIIEGFGAPWDSAQTADGCPLLKVARELGGHHLRQWEAEDLSRISRNDAAALAGLKRVIDDMNMRRSGFIDEVDDWVAEHVRQADDAPLHTETLGSIVDRLAIAWVRCQKLGAKESAFEDSVQTRRSRLATRQLAELGEAYDVLLGDVGSRRRRIPDWRILKSYG
ncbi:DUF4254 domain-containing protein [Catenulispora sp. NF23]|uniref:DUF4254 domain-containing protein n=1 Tax=Catenulispora pinistramenti TaxID=2705254 RepID=A0ABS5KR97_9ACTN|nr:DUF4254 domain-containing protein [Catenulispora pinistramenti]MBS2533095.1 DUF4254 domain-containing protein [Catenulispora pinistramenti]MBS2548578.1 DUF4254 domain-containing protein [Catenulispora pinistramenti]